VPLLRAQELVLNRFLFPPLTSVKSLSVRKKNDCDWNGRLDERKYPIVRHCVICAVATNTTDTTTTNITLPPQPTSTENKIDLQNSTIYLDRLVYLFEEERRVRSSLRARPGRRRQLTNHCIARCANPDLISSEDGLRGRGSGVPENLGIFFFS
jgi:hypothetical protein